jgi:hypothetical protein
MDNFFPPEITLTSGTLEMKNNVAEREVGNDFIK